MLSADLRFFGSAPGSALEHCIGPHTRKHKKQSIFVHLSCTVRVTSFIHPCYHGYLTSLSCMLFFLILFSLRMDNLSFLKNNKLFHHIFYYFKALLIEDTFVEFNIYHMEHSSRGINATLIIQLEPLLILRSELNGYLF